MENLLQDLRYALRSLRVHRGFAFGVVAALAIGIGATSVMFDVIDRQLFRPPPHLRDPALTGRVYLRRTVRGQERTNSDAGYRRFLDLQESAPSIEVMAPFYRRTVALGVGADTREVGLDVSTSALWKMFDVRPVVGRFFGDEDDDPLRPTRVVVLSHTYWKTAFDGRPAAIGQTIVLGTKPYTIIGVAPADFTAFTSEPAIGFVPLASAAEGMGNAASPWFASYNMTWLEIFARRRRESTVEQVNAQLTRGHQLSFDKQRALQPNLPPGNQVKPQAFLGPVLKDRGPTPGALAKVASWLGGVAALVLLISIANVSCLFLLRGVRQQREIAVRLALGAARPRLFRQLITESVLLAIIGGACGVVIARFAGAGIPRALLGPSAGAPSVTDARLLLFALGASLCAGGFASIFPLLSHAGNFDLARSLRAGSRAASPRRSPTRRVLVMSQAALATLLLIGTGLFIRSLSNVNALRLGFNPEKLLYVGLNMRGVQLDTAAAISLRDQLAAKAAAMPHVESASRAVTLPFTLSWSLPLFIEGVDSANKLATFTLQAGGPDLLRTMGTRVLRGRGITADDRAETALVMVVSETMARLLWPGRDPIGQTVRLVSESNPPVTVVGVAEDTRQTSLADPEPNYYLPVSQFRYMNDGTLQGGGPTRGGVFVRTSASATKETESLRRALQSVMPGASYVSVTSLSDIIEGPTRSWRLGATMFSIFGGLALGLGMFGLYAVIAQDVAERRHELAVRSALGASRFNIVRLVMSDVAQIAIPGVAAGVAVSLYAARWVAPLLFHVSPHDISVIATVALSLIGASLLAGVIPSAHAARTAPSDALRA